MPTTTYGAIVVVSALIGKALYSSNQVVDQGQTETLTQTWTGGTSTFTTNFLVSNSADANPVIANMISTGLSTSPNSFTFTVPSTNNALGTITYSGNLVDSTPSNFFMTNTITFAKAVAAGNVVSSNQVVDQGQWETITFVWAGGNPNFNTNIIVSNSADANPIISNAITSGVTGQSKTLTFQVPTTNNALGTLTYSSNVLDSATTFTAAITNLILTNTITFDPQLTATAPTASNAVIDVGQVSTLTSHPTGGTGSYSYVWYTIAGASAPLCDAGNTISGATLSTYTASPIATNTYTYKATDTASTNNAVCSPGATITVHAAVTSVSLVASNTLADQGQWETLTYTWAGGTPNYIANMLLTNSADLHPIIMNSITSGIAGTSQALTAQLPVANNALGTLTMVGNVMDANPFTASITNAILTGTITVNALLQQTRVTSSNAIADQGQWETITDVWSGGTLKYTSNILVSNSADANPIISNSIISACTLTTNALTFQIPSTNNALGTVNVYGNTLDSATAGATNVISNTIALSPALATVSLWSSIPSPAQGQTEVFTGVISGGSSAYTYNFMLSNSADAHPIIANIITINALTTNTFSFTLPASSNDLGVLTYSLKVIDSATTNEIVTTTNTITVTKILTGTSVVASNQVVDQGQTENIIYSYGGGTQPFSVNFMLSNSADAHPIIANQIYTGVSTSGNSYSFTIPSSNNALGTLTFSGNVVDSLAANYLLTNTLTINKALATVNVVSSNAIADQGQAVKLTVVWSGGTSAYTINWMISNSADAHPIIANSIYQTVSGTSNSFSFTIPASNNALGTITYTANIMDAATTNSIATITNTITIKPSPINLVTMTPGNSVIIGSGTVTINSLVTGGTGTFTFQWTDNNAKAVNTLVGTAGSSNTMGSGDLPVSTYQFNVIATDTGTTTPFVLALATNTLYISGINPTPGGQCSPPYLYNITTNSCYLPTTIPTTTIPYGQILDIQVLLSGVFASLASASGSISTFAVQLFFTPSLFALLAWILMIASISFVVYIAGKRRQEEEE
ncbi:MAG: hypothetical protein KGH64_05000 [Candidatus Micrarchaeota archaeon]|nr:hypothetical protein [Candidatus Micrarchaeota archaeon]